MSTGARQGRPDADRLSRIEQVYHDAREREAADRALFLVTTCRDDQNLMEEVASLLELDDAEGPFQQPVLDLAASFLDEPEESDPAPGAMFGPYEILSRIGAGGMGEVFQAHDTRLGRTVALKFVHARFDGNFSVEARAIAALNHPRICTLYDVGPNYLVLELLEGETLAGRLRRGPLAAEEVMTYGAQIADALSYAHSKGITHGDLKPRNLMLTRDGIQILDFGLARFAASEQAAGPAVPAALARQPALGTPAYMSPEQLAEKPGEPRSDIFALGLVLFEMATGARPFTGNSRADLVEAILRADPPLDRLSPPEFAHIVERCLAKEPEDRWQTARDVKLELDYVARALPKPQSPGKVKRHRWLLTAAALLAAIAVPAVYFLQVRPELTITPLTTYPGGEENPSFSPDANQLAFSWNGDQEGDRDIYIKQVGPGDPVRLTTSEADDVMPRWSPDGKWIAFLRREPSKVTGIYMIPALGGLERRLGESAHLGPMLESLDWSPDGQWLIVSAVLAGGQTAGLRLISVDTGQIRQLTSPQPPQSDSEARFAPDGSALAFLREGEGIMTVSLSPEWVPYGQPRRLPVDVTGPIRSITWSGDSHDLFVASGFDQSAWLWRVSTSGNPTAKRMPFGESVTGADVARRGNRMAFSRYDRELNIWSLDLDKTGRGAGRAERAFDSTRSELSPNFSPDGSRVVFGSSRSGDDEIWVCLSDASNCAQLTSLGGSHAGSPSWSPDGNRIVFDVSYPNSWEINVVQASGGKARRLASGLVPRWSHDGKWIYYHCRMRGAMCRVSSSGGDPVELGEGLFPQESPDGQWLYYASRPSGGGHFQLRRKSLTDGKAPEELLPIVTGRDFVVSRRGVWFLSPGNRPESVLSFYDFATGSTRAVYQTKRPANSGLAISPDERRVLFTQVDRSPNVDLFLAEHFR